jgi:hypothetical protein
MAVTGRGHGAIVDLLIQHGANVHQARTDNGDTPLIVASYLARIDVVALLLSHSASVHHLNNDGDTCFTFARDSELQPQPQPYAWTSLPSPQVAHYYDDPCARGASPLLQDRLQLSDRSSPVYRDRAVHIRQ